MFVRGTVTPLGAAARGLIAGWLGSLAIEAFFKATSRWAPRAPRDAFQPPEAAQLSEQPAETVARRVVDDLARAGPLLPDRKVRAGRLVHLAYGGGWGALYGLARESNAGLDCAACGAGWGALVWGASHAVLLPAFGLEGRLQRYPVSHHAYTLAAHAAYGLTTYGAYSALRPSLGPWWLSGVGLVVALLPGRVGAVARTGLAVARGRRVLVG